MRAIDAHLPRDAAGKIAAYAPEGNADYAASGDFDRSLRTVAQLAKMEIGLEFAGVDIGGWDTHEYQQGRFANAVDRLSTGLSAFYDDMARYQGRLTVLVLTEFGRRLRSNRSAGTDHGRAGVMAVLGGRVAGGRIYGPWPGLRSEHLDEGVDLAVATDYRRVITEILGQYADPAGLGAVFPGYKYTGPLGLFAEAAGAGSAKSG
jgi:uncharacterized protein (DUF1501 family)